VKSLRRAEENPQATREQIAIRVEETGERVQHVWEIHGLLLEPMRAYSLHLRKMHKEYESQTDRICKTAMRARGEFARRYLGTKSLEPESLRDILQGTKLSPELGKLDQIFPEFLNMKPTRDEAELLGSHRVSEALLRIICRWEGISVRTARRYKPKESSSVQK
jgi:hypothetical protein